ncbi:cysteine hydrolase family protein [Nitrosomonas sp. Nm166]|uniref:cysteine hydrolase family protein n=1 Tax=Nitrosomonas sp. Nm166 TaxID=1881054 RepID=UPI0008EC5C2C|nr:isochorismatase family cysteine hydrolase [Nitrosomonas sp. Nm166]SFF14308.1 Nicotinamidase-related amidase [Nitrosomonas sp. Nm166]
MKKIDKDKSAHICVDMQKILAEPTEWSTPWAYKILPQIIALTEFDPEKTIFTRFIPVLQNDKAMGMWKKYYERWECMTLEKINPSLIDLIPDLSKFVPPAVVVDKHVYGPWVETFLHQYLQKRGVNTLVISGGETDICVLATVLGAIDFGYRVILATDAVCSSQDDSHDSIMNIYKSRFSIQLEVHDTEKILLHWEK